MVANFVSFVCGDRPTRPPKAVRTIEHIIRDIFTAQGFIGLGIMLQAICSISIPHPYSMLPGALWIAIASWPTVAGLLRLKTKSEDTAHIVGRTAAYLDFADPSHAGKQPGSAAFSGPRERKPTKLAVMLIGSQCHSTLGALQPEFKEMGEVFAGMIHELRTAAPEDDIGFLNAEFYMNSTHPANNSNMACLYFRSYAHMVKFAHVKSGSHWTAWNKFRKLQQDKATLGTQIGLWHEVFEVSNAEGIYINMPRFGLGDMWDAVRTSNGQFVYRNSLVSADGPYTMSEGRMGHESARRAPTGEKGYDTMMECSA